MKKIWEWLGVLAFWGGWPLLWLKLRPTHRSRIILEANGAILFTKSWLSPDDWQLPGGGLHRGEAAEAGAVRELREETGIRLDSQKLTKISETDVTDYGLHFHCSVFVSHLDHQQVLRPQRGELVGAAWISLDQLEHAPLSPLTHRLVSAWLKSQNLLK